MYSAPEWISCPSPTRIPSPPAPKNRLASPPPGVRAERQRPRARSWRVGRRPPGLERPPLYAAPRPRNSSRQALLKVRKGFIASLSNSSTTSRKVLFGARYVSMITRTTLRSEEHTSELQSLRHLV